jgi:hypothetical protein
MPIYKADKDPIDPRSYRPIALSSVLLKVMEHLVKNRVEWFVENNDLLAKSQFGFRKGRSTSDSLGIFTTDIRLAFSRNESVVAAFLDITAAYDNVQLPSLRKKLQELRVPARLSSFIIKMLSERCITFRGNDETIQPSRYVWKGLPQGSVLSPLLFNIYTYDLEQNTEHSSILQYADDILLYSINSKIDIAAETVTKSLESLNVWLEEQGLELSPTKSNVVIFTRKVNIPRSMYL